MRRLQWTLTALLLCTPLAALNRGADLAVTGLGVRIEGYANSGHAVVRDWHNVEPSDHKMICAVYREDMPQLTLIARTASVNTEPVSPKTGIVSLACRNATAEAICQSNSRKWTAFLVAVCHSKHLLANGQPVRCQRRATFRPAVVL